MGGNPTDQIVSGPDQNLWFTDGGTPMAIGRVSLQLGSPTTTTGSATTASVTSGSTASSPSPAAASASSSTSATFGDQRITLTTPSPSACTAKTGSLPVTLSSTAIPMSHAMKLRFASAALYLDRGVRHSHKLTRRSHGKTRTLTVLVYTPNAILRHAPATVGLGLAGLSAGLHTLKVKVSYKQTVTRHHQRHTVTVTKTLSSQFRVC